MFEQFEAWRHEKNIGNRFTNERIAACADHRRALRINVEQHIHAAIDLVQNRFTQRAVKMPVHVRVFQKLARCRAPLELLTRDEKIVLPLNFSRPRRARGA